MNKENIKLFSFKQGMVLYLVLSIAMILGLMIPIYFSFSQQVALSSFQQLNEDRIARLSSVAHKACFEFLRDKANLQGHSFARFLEESMNRTTTQTKSGWENDSDFQKYLEVCIPEDVSIDKFKCKITTKVFDQCQTNSLGYKYYSGEGLANLEIVIQSSLYRGSKLLSSCEHTRRYDLKMACMFTPDNDGYTMGFPLRYALFVRDAKNETNDINNFGRYYAHGQDKYIKLANNGPIYLHGIASKITRQGTLLTTSQKFFSFDGNEIFIGKRGGNGLRPFRHFTLFAVRLYNSKAFEETFFYDKKKGNLYLPGLIEVQTTELTLPPPENGGPITVFGRGGISAPDGIVIKSGIKLNDPNKDLCVFFSRKRNIKVETSSPIQASLIALGDNSVFSSSIKSSQDVNVYGCVAVDRLFSQSQPLKCNIEYDPRFLNNQKIYSAALLPWVKLDNKIFSREDLVK